MGSNPVEALKQLLWLVYKWLHDRESQFHQYSISVVHIHELIMNKVSH